MTAIRCTVHCVEKHVRSVECLILTAPSDGVRAVTLLHGAVRSRRLCTLHTSTTPTFRATAIVDEVRFLMASLLSHLLVLHWSSRGFWLHSWLPCSIPSAPREPTFPTPATTPPAQHARGWLDNQDHEIASATFRVEVLTNATYGLGHYHRRPSTSANRLVATHTHNTTSTPTTTQPLPRVVSTNDRTATREQ